MRIVPAIVLEQLFKIKTKSSDDYYFSKVIIAKDFFRKRCRVFDANTGERVIAMQGRVDGIYYEVDLDSVETDGILFRNGCKMRYKMEDAVDG